METRALPIHIAYARVPGTWTEFSAGSLQIEDETKRPTLGHAFLFERESPLIRVTKNLGYSDLTLFGTSQGVEIKLASLQTAHGGHRTNRQSD